MALIEKTQAEFGTTLVVVAFSLVIYQLVKGAPTFCWGVRFDEIRARNQRTEIDRLAAIKGLFELVINNFQKFYTPSEYTPVDEQLVKFRRRYPFKMYIPREPGKYGIKIFHLSVPRPCSQ